jgi:hypothetical protein
MFRSFFTTSSAVLCAVTILPADLLSTTAQFLILFGDQKCVVVTSRVRSLIKFLHLWASRVEIYIHFFCPRRRPWTVVWRKCVCVCVWGGGGGARRTWAILVFFPPNLRNFYSRFCVQQYIIADFLEKVPSGLPRAKFPDLTLQSTSLRTTTVCITIY